jgi:hypothetical protein
MRKSNLQGFGRENINQDQVCELIRNVVISRDYSVGVILGLVQRGRL